MEGKLLTTIYETRVKRIWMSLGDFSASKWRECWNLNSVMSILVVWGPFPLVLDCKLDKWFQDRWDITACMSYHGHLMTFLWGRDVVLFPGWGGGGGLKWKQERGRNGFLRVAWLSLRTTLNEAVGGVFICKGPCWLLTYRSFETDFWHCDQSCLFLNFFFLKIFWKILVSEKEPSPKGQKLRVYRLVLALWGCLTSLNPDYKT